MMIPHPLIRLGSCTALSSMKYEDETHDLCQQDPDKHCRRKSGRAWNAQLHPTMSNSAFAVPRQSWHSTVYKQMVNSNKEHIRMV